jgi:hypothetical protein
MIAISVGLAALACLAAGCAPRFELRFETSGPALTGDAAQQLAATTDISALAGVTTTEAVTMRASVLADLRTSGSLGRRTADLLTIGFPARTPSVPVLVRACPVDGKDAILVVEAYGSPGGTLTHRRLWVFDRASGALLLAASFR